MFKNKRVIGAMGLILFVFLLSGCSDSIAGKEPPRVGAPQQESAYFSMDAASQAEAGTEVVPGKIVFMDHSKETVEAAIAPWNGKLDGKLWELGIYVGVFEDISAQDTIDLANIYREYGYNVTMDHLQRNAIGIK